MERVLLLAAAGLALWATSCLAMMLFASRLPDGLMRQVAEFLPVIGPLDDVVAVILLLRYAARSIPRDTLLAAWPSDPTLLERLLGPARAPSANT
jgi:hypothetical protein